MTTYTQLGSGINTTIYDTLPYIAPSAGEGAPGVLRMQEDQVAVTRTAFGTAGNFVRLCRFPATAKIKKLELFTDLNAVDSNGGSSALVLQTGVVFSDSTIDGTPPNYQNLMPTTVGIGGGATTPGTAVAIGGSNANYLFGTQTVTAGTGLFTVVGANLLVINSNVLFGGEITFGGTIATYGEPLVWTQEPLTNLFNFRDGQGNLVDSLGYMDIIVVCNHAYGAQPAGAYNMYARLTYVA